MSIFKDVISLVLGILLAIAVIAAFSILESTDQASVLTAVVAMAAGMALGSERSSSIYRRTTGLCLPLLILSVFMWDEHQEHYLLLLSVVLPSTVLGLWLRTGPFSIERIRLPMGAWTGLLLLMYFLIAPSYVSRISTEVGNATIGTFDVSLLDGTVLSSEDLEGRVVLLDFWTSWCAPCVSQMPDMVTIPEKYKNRDDFVFVAVNRGEDLETVRGFVKRHSYAFPVGIDTSGYLGGLFKTNPIPQSILIGKNGGLRLRHVGRDGAEDLVAALSNHIDGLLAE